MRDEKENSLKMQKQLDEAGPLIENLQKRIDLLENRRRLSAENSGLIGELSDTYSIELFKSLELENQQLKRQLDDLQTVNRSNEQRIFAESIIEKENEALRAQIEAFLAEGDLSVFTQNKSVHGPGSKGFDLTDQLPIHDLEFDKKVSSLERFPTTDFSSDHQKEIGKRGFGFGHSAYQSEIIFTTIMSFYKNELGSNKKFVVPRKERYRNVFKQFMLTDMLQTHN